MNDLIAAKHLAWTVIWAGTILTLIGFFMALLSGSAFGVIFLIGGVIIVLLAIALIRVINAVEFVKMNLDSEVSILRRDLRNKE